MNEIFIHFAVKPEQRDSRCVFLSSQISAVRAVVPNKSNNEIVLVLQHFENCVDKAVQAFLEGMRMLLLISEFTLLKDRRISGFTLFSNFKQTRLHVFSSPPPLSYEQTSVASLCWHVALMPVSWSSPFLCFHQAYHALNSAVERHLHAFSFTGLNLETGLSWTSRCFVPPWHPLKFSGRLYFKAVLQDFEALTCNWIN